MREASMVAESSADEIRAIDSSLMTKVFFAFAALAILSLGISVGGKWFGRSIVMAGHTDDPTIREIVVGNNVIAAPSNAIRFERARRDGVAQRVDLYLHWPEMTGYSEALRDDFNHARGSRNIVFLSFEERMMSRDMSGRFAPIYEQLIIKPGVPGPGQTTLYGFNEKSGYLNELLAVGRLDDGELFVARCLNGAAAEESLAPCERDIHLGDNLSLSYRFPKQLLGNWRELETAMRKKAAGLLRTGG